MCTLTLAWKVLDDAPVAVAANRDEALERPSEPPGIYRKTPRVVAPRDTEAGGTWIGVNEYGVVAGITNRWLDRETDADRSRGLLVGDTLECESVLEALEVVEQTTTENEYDGFNLVLADADDAVCLEWDGELTVTGFDPGVHVVVNVGFVGAGDTEQFSIPDVRPEVGAGQAESARRVRDALAVDPDGEHSSAWLERAGTVLGDHEYGVCVHGDGFGTRSSSLLSVGRSEPVVDSVSEPESESESRARLDPNSRLTYAYADGPPCRTPYEAVDVEGHI
ncbi:NRDE family protein [Natronoglomus mannanivorans]|uniref:NRDE family protein n=1 Tax=Natronoglomus mannanivorans TaxID=2979990 RepID=A0AAP2YZ17_9EURY|nr:NRDE family protein [Halobacteria archaeon AArc-xg1-1]